jgi:predicted dehydrogenase
LGLTHDHIWDHLPDLKTEEGVELVSAADPHLALRERCADEFGCAVYERYEDVWADDSLDGVFIYADNATGAELAIAAAQAGRHLLIEKPMASDLESADTVLVQARQAGVRVMVNWPFAWWPQLQHALRLANSGDVGEVWQVRYRAAHEGPREMGCSPYFCDWLYDPARNGAGGALTDYCCYGALLARTVIGLPSRVSGTAGRFVKQDIEVEDNAILVMTYPHALAVSEGSWTHIGKLGAYVTMIFGERGTLLIEPRDGGRLLRADPDHPEGVAVPVPEAPPHLRNATAHFAHGLRTGEAFCQLCDDRLCRDTQEILEAGLISAEEGREVSLPLK